MAVSARLSEQQSRAVSFDEGALLVVAGPGSGKTRVLTERVRRLLSESKGHFRVLALTFTNKAAAELAERLEDLGDLKQRAFIGTLHGFCLEVLADRGRPVGVLTHPQIFENTQDRKQILLESVLADPLLSEALLSAGDSKERGRRLDAWLRAISLAKTHPISHAEFSDPTEQQIFDAYNSGLRKCGAYDFDDLLLLTYQLLTEQPKIADFYRRLYRYICIDEAQDLNEAQYAVLCALCGTDFRNVMMVGDPKQSIYGFNSSGPQYMEKFQAQFGAERIELTENFRSSLAIVRIARKLEPSYNVQGQLPISGRAELIVGSDEEDEARAIVDELQRLFQSGDPDVEGGIQPEKCAILARTRFSLLATEQELKSRDIPYYKRLSSAYENDSELVEDFQLALRVLVNPNDLLHLNSLAKRWRGRDAAFRDSSGSSDAIQRLSSLEASETPRSAAVIAAVSTLAATPRLDLMQAISKLRSYADGLPNEEKRSIYDDTSVLALEWDQYLRKNSSARSLAGFLSSVALGTTQQIHQDGVALLTVHSSKGLEFDVVFVVGMAEGVFPDYRSLGKAREGQEERRNAFVAVTRSKRLIYFSYPASRKMPWGDVWASRQSSYLNELSGLYTKRMG